MSLNNEKLTPMLQQYMDIKENTKDALVFYRLGDFYELFFEDALIASKALDLVLTQRNAGNNQKAPMCGVPHHAAKSYIQKLVNQGFKVAIVEQVEDPKEAKGLVRREVVEIVTPGTFIEHDSTDTNVVAAIHTDLVYATLVMADIISGSLRSIRVMNESMEIIKTLQQFQITELVVDDSFNADLLGDIEDKVSISISHLNEIDKSVKHEKKDVEHAYRKLMGYLKYTSKRDLDHLSDLVVLNDLSYLKMDYASISNLELIQHSNNKDLSLYSFMNHTITNMGARLLKDSLLQPLVDLDSITKRQDQVAYLMSNISVYDRVRDALKMTYDIHRVLARITTYKHNAQDFVRLKKTLMATKDLISILKDNALFNYIIEIDPLSEVVDSLEYAINDDAPVQLKEGRTFKRGINDELDELLSITKDGRKWLLEYEAQERERTGIKNLKVGYTRAFGYYIEISKGQIENVSEEFGYIRRQTLTNAERYISEALQTHEERVLKASDRILEIENELFDTYTAYVLKYSSKIHNIGEQLALLDMMTALTYVSSLPGYTRPSFNSNQSMRVIEGRHPVLENELRDHQYISSDVIFNEDHRLQILTGPNMGGKSTYMRMVALMVIMAQMGSFVSASSADLYIVDQIFTRMGASDDILMGQSTFMVEMLEAQTALSNATKQSLILFDEIGRGTSTYDGMALAQGILEYIVYSIGCNTLFSTHYHELTALETLHEGVKNIHVEVHEEDDKVTFLYRVIQGRANKSYGINVARLAHLPQSVIERANKHLEGFETNQTTHEINKVIYIESEPHGYELARNLLNKVDPDYLTPMEALVLVGELKKALGESDE
jgi:DNA mismatch repair protein MutS